MYRHHFMFVEIVSWKNRLSPFVFIGNKHDWNTWKLAVPWNSCRNMGENSLLGSPDFLVMSRDLVMSIDWFATQQVN